MKRPVKIAIGVVAVAALLFVALLGAMSLLFPPARVKAIVLEKAGAALQREVKLDDASIRIFPFLGVSLEGFEIANNPDSGFAKEPLLKLASLDVKLSTMSLFRMAPVVNGIVLKGPRIRVEVLPDGRTSLDGLGGPKDTAAPEPKTDSVKPLELPFPLSVERIAIEDGSVSWLDRKDGREIVLGDIDQEISLESDAKLENVASKGRIDLRDVSVSGSGMPVRKGGIRVFLEHDVHLNLPGAVVEIASLKFGVQDLALELSGKVSNILVSPVLDMRLRTVAPVDLGKLLAEIPQEISPELAKVSLQGTFAMDMTAKGGVTGGQIPVVDGSLHLASVGASVRGVPAKIEKLGLALHIKNTSTIEIDSTSWLLNGDQAHLLVALDSLPIGADSLRKPVLRAFDAKGGIDLAALRQVAAPMVPILDTMAPVGRIAWEIKAKGVLDPANPMGLSASGDVKLQKIETSLPGGAKDRVKLDGSVGVTNTTANLALAILSGPTDLSIKGDAADWLVLAMPKLASGRIAKVNVAIKANTIDVDRFLPPPDTTKKVEQASTKPLELPKLPPMVLKASFDANLIKVMGLGIEKTQARLSLEGGKLVESISGGVAKGAIRQNMSADLSNPANLSAKFAAGLTGVQIHDVMIGIKDRIPPGTARDMHDKIFGTGNVNVTASVDGPPAKLADILAADLSMDLKDGRIEGLPAAKKLGDGIKKVVSKGPSLDPIQFASFILVAQLREGRTEIKDMRIDGADVGMIKANGFLNKDQTMDMKVATHMPQSTTGLLQGGAGAVASASGPVASALGVSAGQALPQDEQNRVILSWLVTGPFSSPTVRPDATALTAGAKAAAAAAFDAAKAKAEAEAARIKAEAEARAKAEADKIKAAADAKANEAKNKAKDAVKGKLKGLGL